MEAEPQGPNAIDGPIHRGIEGTRRLGLGGSAVVEPNRQGLIAPKDDHCFW